MVAGRYFDGQSSRARPALFSLGNGSLRIECDELVREVALADLEFALSRGRAPTRIALRGGGLCELADTPELHSLLRALGARRPALERFESHRNAIVGVLIVFLALMAVIWRWGIPLAADGIVDRVPLAWESRLGETALGQLDEGGIFRSSTLADARQAQIRAAFARLRRPEGSTPAHIVFRRLGVPNAFALPGGTIVMADELVVLAQDDDSALMTVLGHELGHVQARDGLRALVRATLFSTLAAWYLGDISSFVASAGAGITSLSYSRAAESAADGYALQLMRANAISTRGAALLFQRLAGGATGRDGDAAKGASASTIPEYLSTHPDIQERIRRFERGADDAGAARAAPP